MASHPRELWAVAQKSVWFGLEYAEVRKCSCLNYIPFCIRDQLWNTSFLYWQGYNVNATWFTVKLCCNVAFCTSWYHFNRCWIEFSTITQPRYSLYLTHTVLATFVMNSRASIMHKHKQIFFLTLLSSNSHVCCYPKHYTSHAPCL